MEPVGLSDRPIWSGGDFRRRQRVCDLHCARDILTGRQPQEDTPAQISECEIAAPARKVVKLRHDEGVEFSRSALRVTPTGFAATPSLREPAPVDDPVA